MLFWNFSHCSKGVATIALCFLIGCVTFFRFTTVAVLKQRGVFERGYDIRVYHQSICFLQGWGWRIQSRIVSSVMHFTPPINKICEEQRTRCWKTAMRNSVTSNHEMQLDNYVLWSLYEMILRISCEAFYSDSLWLAPKMVLYCISVSVFFCNLCACWSHQNRTSSLQYFLFCFCFAQSAQLKFPNILGLFNIFCFIR